MNEQDKHIEIEYLTVKKLTGEASPSELDTLDSLLDNHPENKRFYHETQLVWEKSASVKGITETETIAEWDRLRAAMHQAPEASILFSPLKIAATVSLLILSAALIYIFIGTPKSTEIVASNTQVEKTLVDGSHIILNSQSTLTYNEDFNIKLREVELVGEAYFDVTPDKTRPFLIHAQGLDVTVVGTSFNVLANKSENTVEVVVSSGIVKLTQNGASILLEVGEKGTVNKKTGQLSKTNNQNKNFDAWRTKKIYFEETPLSRAIQLINNVYNQNLYIESNTIKTCTITVSFDGSTFESIMKVLTATLNLTLEETKKGTLISGEGC